MKRMRTKKIRTLIILSAYVLLLGIPSMEIECCGDLHLKGEQPASEHGFDREERNAHHSPPVACREEGVLTPAAYEGAHLQAACCCLCHKHNLPDRQSAGLALPVRYSPAFQAAKIICPTGVISSGILICPDGSVSPAWYGAVGSTNAAFRTTVLLI